MAAQPLAPVSDDASTKTSDFLSEFFTEDQLARVLDRNVRTTRRWDALGIGPPRIRVGRKILYKKSSVERWLQQNESRPPRRKGAR